MKCPACSDDMIKAQATDYGAAYDYCRTCKKEHTEIMAGFLKPVTFDPKDPSPFTTNDGTYTFPRAGSAGFDGNKFLCLGGCGQRVDPALKYCKPTCGMNKQQAAVNPVPMTGDTAFFNSQHASCGNLYRGCDCNGCQDAKLTVTHTRRYIPNRDEYIAECTRAPFPCRTEKVAWNRSGFAAVHYYHRSSNTCHCGMIAANMVSHLPAANSPMPAMQIASTTQSCFGCSRQVPKTQGYCDHCRQGKYTPPPGDTY